MFHVSCYMLHEKLKLMSSFFTFIIKVKQEGPIRPLENDLDSNQNNKPGRLSFASMKLSEFQACL